MPGGKRVRFSLCTVLEILINWKNPGLQTSLVTTLLLSMDLLLSPCKLFQACSKAGMPAAIFVEGSLVLSTNFVVAADSLLDVADACPGFAATMASVADVVWDSAALVDTAVGADSLGVLKFSGDSFAEAVDTAVGADSVGVLKFSGNSSAVADWASAVAVIFLEALDCLGDFVAVAFCVAAADSAVAADVLAVPEFAVVSTAVAVSSAVANLFVVPEFSGDFSTMTDCSTVADLLGVPKFLGDVATVAVSTAVVDFLGDLDFMEEFFAIVVDSAAVAADLLNAILGPLDFFCFPCAIPVSVAAVADVLEV
jgi:hypothetical protein